MIVKRLSLGDRLAVGQQTLTLFTVVRIHVPQPKQKPPFGGFCFGLRDSRKELQVRQFLGAPSQKGEGATKKLPLCERRSRAAKKSPPFRQYGELQKHLALV